MKESTSTQEEIETCTIGKQHSEIKQLRFFLSKELTAF